MSPKEIREMRLGAGLTMQQFSQELGVVVDTVFKWEHGRSCPQNLGRKALQAFKERLELNQAEEVSHAAK